jgi:hypothetical protein
MGQFFNKILAAQGSKTTMTEAEIRLPRGWQAEIERFHAEPDLRARSAREGCPPSRAFFMENKRPGLFGPHHVAFPVRRAGTKGEVDPSMQCAKALHGGTAS